MLWLGIFLAVAAALGRVLRRVDVILHIGAHRTGTTTLQRLLQQNTHNLRKKGVTVWTPRDTRDGLFEGLLTAPADRTPADHARIRRNLGRIALRLEMLERAGQTHLIVSEENMMGSMRTNCWREQLYPQVSERLAGFRAAFGGRIRRVALGVRRYDCWWASALAYGIPVGFALPDAAGLERLAIQPRRWPQILREVARVFRGAELVVWDFDDVIGNPSAQFAALTAGRFRGAFRPFAGHHNASPPVDALRRALAARGAPVDALPLDEAGRFMPFSPDQRAGMAQAWAEDRAWLEAGAEGLARFVGRPASVRDAWQQWKMGKKRQ